MIIRRLALISTLALGLALAGSAFAQEQVQRHEAHHEDAAAASGGDAAGPTPAAGDDDAAPDAMAMGGAGMMMCSRMMAMMGEMMGGGGGHSGQGGMKGDGMQMMKDHPPMMGGDHMKGHGKAGMAQHGLARLLTADEVGKRLDQMIAHNKRLKVGKLEPGGDFSFSAEITTVEGSLVHKLLVDRRDGSAWEVD